MASSDISGAAPSAGGHETTLESALAELDALPTPAGVDTSTFAQMKSALATALRASGVAKFPSQPPTDDANQIKDLTRIDDGTGHYILTWHYRNVGDYDQNGTVGVTDLTPLAVYFNQTVTDPNSLQGVVDGNEDGIINIADITPIAMHFGSNVTQYEVQDAAAITGPWTELGSMVPFSEGKGPERLFFEAIIAETATGFGRVEPLDSDNLTGIASNTVELTETAETPEILSVMPKDGLAGTSATFSAVVDGTAPLTYAWDFGGGATPNTSSEASPTVMLGSAGSYFASLQVTNGFGSANLSFVLTVTGTGTAPKVNFIDPAGGGVSGMMLRIIADVSGTTPIDYSWNFGGGATPNTSTLPSPVITLGPPAVYMATLTVNNAFGSDTFSFEFVVTPAGFAPTIDFIMPAEGVTGTAITVGADVSGTAPVHYSWDFGGAGTPNTSTSAMPSIMLGAPGEYSGTLTVSNDFGTDTDPFFVRVVTAGEPPVIEGVTPTEGMSGSIITLTTNVIGTPPFNFDWNFGGAATPNTSIAAIPTVTLGAVGTYNASLTVTSPFGTDTLDFTMTVTAAGTPAHIDFVTPMEGVAGSLVTFSSGVTGTPPFTYSWNFGGGATPNTTDFATPTVTLGATGTYNASLTVTNAFGSDTYDFTLTVTAAGQAPHINSVSPLIADADDHVLFLADVTGSPILHYEWDFAGGATPDSSKKSRPWENIGSPGTYNCTLTVYNAFGSDSFNFTLTVLPKT